ncbi:LysR family transcriptional regulator [Curtobacterium sp. 9128]|uniref:LysR family transcriptional regulator n=1 Tax=Curtobacterium sp. 9128 TaxID=1793722 RepID=UPI00119DDB1C|nr:LysR family transcriptional regulator [Curtobacterium sp. 9128]
MELLEIREIRAFMAVAELLHFGRAAARLRVAQPALSKTIRRMEERLGTALFIRSTRSVTLTAAGRALKEHGRHALNAVDAAVDRVRRAAEGCRIRLVMKAGGDAGMLSVLLTAHSANAAADRVEVVFAGGAERTRLIQEGKADVGLLYVPFDDTTGLRTSTLLAEDRVAILPETHPLSERAEIDAAELDGELFPRWVGVPDDRLDAPEITDVAELIPLVHIGRVVAVLPRSLVTPTPPGITCVPVRDAETSSIVLAWRTDEQRTSVLAFVEAAIRATQQSAEPRASSVAPPHAEARPSR